MNQAELTEKFRQLHSQRPLILPNAWDAASARVIERAGAQAIATTSAGVAWVHGYGDGQKLERDQMIAAIREIVQAVGVPVTADIEGGYGAGSPEDIAQTVRAVLGTGAVGINLEDSPGRNGETLLSAEAHAEQQNLSGWIWSSMPERMFSWRKLASRNPGCPKRSVALTFTVKLEPIVCLFQV
jgi:2-methylisocitrate lyase-like PEP mutase family enzyme